ncbi:IclR family transcriptional regulator [Brevibacterium sandarakinum]|uniref:IclR family transcriptional regulator n=1 Tax=Brevibacterium sandarakinum TaxID=629680 RepID=UPI00264A8F4B|nr:IclR family transcriptional regulator [Brevibacterium sandarakinum]MDN5634667.1 IclR family transcriptional regulator [Brevibacterium sp.]MDN5656623.1 IclR family transcriptional regulator [Brevibacterium sandarakinum]
MPRQSSDTSHRGASVIENTVSILRCFSPDRQELGVTEIAPRVGLHKSTVSRILTALEAQGIVEQESSRRYRLGLGILAIAGPLLADLDVRRAAYPILQDLTRRTEETSALIVWNGTEAITVEQIPSPQQVKHTSSLGSRYQTAHSASVQVFLDVAEITEVRALADSGSLLDLDSAPENFDAYRALLRSNRQRGYALNDARTSPNEVGIAAGVHDHRGALIAAVLIAAPKFRTDADQIAELGQCCVEAARRVSQRLGGL